MNKNSLFKSWTVLELPILYFLFFFCCITGVYAQNTTITGTVTDDKGALPGVIIAIKGKSLTALSNQNGSYIITASPADTLVFSYIGYKTVEIVVNSRPTINMQMQGDASMLQEVTINAGYYSVKEKERTGSIAKITAATIEKQPVTNILATMEGRMAGVNITQTTGIPGGGFDIQIRGRNSLRSEGNNPLYIIDGMPYPSESSGNTIISGGLLPGTGINPLNGINPSDIESIEILKDADATAIYGSLGANGVVLITTKKGKSGKTEFSINTYTGTGQVTKTLHLMNTPQYLEMRREAFANDGFTQLPDWAYDVNGTWDQNRYTDWQKELIGGTAYTQNIQTAVSGGNSNTQFLVQGTYFKETTVFPGDFSYRKSALHFNINHVSENNKFNISLSGNYVADKNNLPGTDLTREAAALPPNAPELYDENGNLNWENSTWNNPLRLLQEKYLAKTNNLTASSVLGYKILPNLEIKTTLGFMDTHLEESKKSPFTIYNPAYGLDSSVSYFLLNQTKQQSWSIEPQLSYQQEIGKGTLKILTGLTLQERTKEQLGIYGSGFSSNSLINNIAAATNIAILNNDNSLYRYNAVFGRVNYNWEQKYILNLTGRRDGSSRFGSGNRFANFGALGAAWLFGKEDFVTKNIPFLSFGKLRTSYGLTGSDQIGDYQFLNTYSSSGASYQGIIGLQPNRLYNPNFSWETNKKLEIALDAGFLKDRVFITTAYYRNRSSNQLVGMPLPGTTGFTSIQSNLEATVENSGWEMEWRILIFQKKQFRWNINSNMTIPRNKLIAFPGLEGSTYANQYVIGQPIDIRKVYHYTGINSQTGIYQFEDYNTDGVISAPEDRQGIARTNPDFFGGIENGFSYKNWQLDFLFQFVKQKGLNYNYTGALPGIGNNQPVAILDHWQQIGDTNPIQRYTAGFNDDAVNAFYNYASSDAIYTDASFARLKNLSLSYTLPETWIKTAKCRIYLQGQNLLTLTRFSGPDPENQAQGNLPPLRVLTMGVQLNF